MGNDIGVWDVLGLIGFMGFYITLKILVYSKEYGTQKDKRDIVIKRGSEWDYEHKGNENQNKNK
jgi:hypothetical protein